MSLKNLKHFVSAFAVFAFCATAVSQEKVDNPRYLEWAKYKPGTMLKMAGNVNAAGQEIKTEMTTTLKDVSAEKLILEIKMTSILPGVPPQDKTMTMVEPAKIEKSKVKPVSPEQMPGCKVNGTGTEDIKVGDKTYKCKWYDTEIQQQGMKMNSKMWVCDEIPDKMVKNESTMPMGTSTMVLVEFKAVK